MKAESPCSVTNSNLNIQYKIVHSQSAKNPAEPVVKPFLNTPKPSFRLIQEKKPAKALTTRYVRYCEPSEEELEERIEYDMDEQDKCWLSLLNEHRKSLGEKNVPELFFEQIMDKLEKEWFELRKEISKVETVSEEDENEGHCDICNDGECENSNAIVFCDGCNLAVHQDCYGIPFIPEGQWLCRKCMVSPGHNVSCMFCPNDAGAFKQTVTNKWAHSICALWIPEVGVANPVYMEPIDSIEKIPKSRWKLTCYICKIKMGCCIQCDNKFCFTPFHATCAKRAGLFMKIQAIHGKDHVSMRACCDRHTPKDYPGEQDIGSNLLRLQKEYVKLRRKLEHRNEMRDDLDSLPNTLPQKKKIKKKKDLKSSSLSIEEVVTETEDEGQKEGVPVSFSDKDNQKIDVETMNKFKHIVPNYVFQRILTKITGDGCSRIDKSVTKKPALLIKICKYWALKREKGRGAPLLKRLHLEPWTAATSAHKEDEQMKKKRQESLVRLRDNLSLIRAQTENIHKRERKKLMISSVVKEYLEVLLKPLSLVLGNVLEEVKNLDKERYFWEPVSTLIVPDYLLIVKEPMYFSKLSDKINNYEYKCLEQFENDLLLVFKNAMTYNNPATPYFKSASILLALSQELLLKTRNEDAIYKSIDSQTFTLPYPISPSMFSYGVTSGEEEAEVGFNEFFGLDNTSNHVKKPKKRKNGVDVEIPETEEDTTRRSKRSRKSLALSSVDKSVGAVDKMTTFLTGFGIIKKTMRQDFENSSALRKILEESISKKKKVK